MTKLFNKLINVLWAIEKDLHAIASSMEAKQEYSSKKITNGTLKGRNVNLENNHENRF